MAWTSERQAELERLAASGASARQAASALGVTRNAVLGRAFRTGVQFDGELKRRAENRKERVSRMRLAQDLRSKSREDTAERQKRAREMYLADATYTEIVIETGYSPGHIPALTKGLPRRRRGRRTDYDDTLVIDALVRCLTGESVRRVALATGIPQGSLCNWLYHGSRPNLLVAARYIAKEKIAAQRAEAEAARLASEEADRAHRAEVDAANAEALSKLPARLREVIVGRLAGDTLKAIGERLGVTRERVRQLEAQARIRYGVRLYNEKPLSEACKKTRGIRTPKPTLSVRKPRVDPFKLAWAIMDGEEGRRRPRASYTITPEERERRRDRMRRVANQLWAERRAGGQA